MRLRCAAWVALGKLCLADGGLAKQCVPLMVQSLTSGMDGMEVPQRGEEEGFGGDAAGSTGAAAPVPRHVREAPVRNNVAMVLAELCKQYTGLVDHHVPALAACLADPCGRVRAHVLAVLGELLM